MPSFSLIRPLDQPLGSRRLLEDLRNALASDEFIDFRVTVAYAKSGPLYRLQQSLEAWRAQGKTSAAIFGIDQQGTSQDALELAHHLFDRLFITRQAGITFHPKIYMFKGSKSARVFVGSNNLTVGGTEKNFESAVQLDLELPDDSRGLSIFETAWQELLPNACPATFELNSKLLQQLVSNGSVVPESQSRQDIGDHASVGQLQPRAPSVLDVKPESPLPPRAVRRHATHSQPHAPKSAARGFALQIKPHHNGEILLSVTAARQNPSFFRWPFQGKTTPKKPGNPSYPQLVPDPIVDIVVFGANRAIVLRKSRFRLNTVYYQRRSEIRITASPLVDVVPEYSIMIMEPSNKRDVTYQITIHRPDSPDYPNWESACNQTLPGGGLHPRKYGWF